MTTLELGQLMKSLRNLKGFSINELSDICGVPERTIQRLERGENVTVDVFLLILKTLELKFEIRSV